MGGINKKRRRNNKNNKKNDIKKTKKLDEMKSMSSEQSEEAEFDISKHNDEVENISKKRSYDNNDSDYEGEPKKKKKQHLAPVGTETTNKNQKKKSIRQMKKEKYLERLAATEAANKEQLKEQCLSYISQWKHDQTNWKFMKAKQIWLNKNKFSRTLIPDESWPLLLEYLQSSKGNIRNILLDDANKVIKQMEEWTESQENKDDLENEADESPETKKPDDVVYKRARDLIQGLQE
ncbi:LOW QUALITY PROTEIN: uncharacterized protein ACR2FA_012560 [Aphomia sociella]